jgi:catechol 2,3-dioxygenase-like lactoylglutathione lyase family enzyme
MSEVRIKEIAFIGYPVTDLERSRRFYEGTLGLKQTSFFGDENAAWIEYDIGPGTLAIGNGAPQWKPSPGGGVAGLEVEDFDAAIARLKADGVSFQHEPADTPVCRMAVVFDPDGNSLIIHKRMR